MAANLKAGSGSLQMAVLHVFSKAYTVQGLGAYSAHMESTMQYLLVNMVHEAWQLNVKQAQLPSAACSCQCRCIHSVKAVLHMVWELTLWQAQVTAAACSPHTRSDDTRLLQLLL